MLCCHAGRIDGDFVHFVEPGEVFIENFFDEPRRLLEVFLPSELPLEKLEVAGRAVNKLVASERGEPDEARDGLVALQESRIFEKATEASAGTIELLERIFARAGCAVEMPAASLVFNVGG